MTSFYGTKNCDPVNFQEIHLLTEKKILRSRYTERTLASVGAVLDNFANFSWKRRAYSQKKVENNFGWSIGQ